MKRTDADGHDGNRYSEGNPSLGVLPTVVGAEELNNIQEEIANVVDDAGIVLDALVENQLLSALGIILERGGTLLGNFAVVDNQVGPVNVTTIPAFDKTKVKAARLLVDIHRRDDGQSANEVGELFISHDTEADAWEVTFVSHGADAGVTFSIAASGQILYTSTNFGGANYSGTIRASQITTVKL